MSVPIPPLGVQSLIAQSHDTTKPLDKNPNLRHRSKGIPKIEQMSAFSSLPQTEESSPYPFQSYDAKGSVETYSDTPRLNQTI